MLFWPSWCSWLWWGRCIRACGKIMSSDLITIYLNIYTHWSSPPPNMNSHDNCRRPMDLKSPLKNQCTNSRQVSTGSPPSLGLIRTLTMAWSESKTFF
jgi:hypothetical protein